MALVQSGFPVIGDYGSPELDVHASVYGVEFPGGIRKGDVTTVLLYWAGRWHNEVEHLIAGHCWGYDKRDIRGGTGWSNHAGGCAIDINAPEHPQHTYTLSDADIAKIRRIRDDCDGVIRWGGDWTPASVDQQHAEINLNLAGTGRVEALAAKIRAGQVPNVPAELLRKDAPNPVKHKPKPGVRVKGVTVEDAQRALNAHGADPELIPDGDFGPKTTDATNAAKKKLGLPQDGVFGSRLWRAIGPKKVKYTPPPGPWPLKPGEYFGLESGPSQSHGGYRPADRPYIRWIKRRLRELGYKVPAGDRFHTRMEKAVARWQHDRHNITTSRPGEVWSDDFQNLIKDR